MAEPVMGRCPLPPELFLRIFELLHDSNDLRSLAQLATVSHAGNRLVTPFLYRTVVLEPASSRDDRFRDTVVFRPLLAGLVRTLLITSATDRQVKAAILEACHGITQIFISGEPTFNRSYVQAPLHLDYLHLWDLSELQLLGASVWENTTRLTFFTTPFVIEPLIAFHLKTLRAFPRLRRVHAGVLLDQFGLGHVFDPDILRAHIRLPPDIPFTFALLGDGEAQGLYARHLRGEISIWEIGTPISFSSEQHSSESNKNPGERLLSYFTRLF